MSALDFLIIFAGTVIAAVYFCIGIAAFWSRISQPELRRPYRMPLWPLPPLVVIAFTGLALVKQEGKYLVAEAVLAGAAIVLWALSRLWGGDASGRGPLEPAPAAPVEGALGEQAARV
jgi:amino acid transporter